MPTEAELAAQLAEATARNKELQNKVEVLSQSQNDLDSLAKRNADMEAKLKAIEEENRKIAFERDRDAVLKQYPNAIPEFVSGANKAEMEAKAKALHERIELEKTNAAKAKEAEVAKAWGSVNPGGQQSLHEMKGDEWTKQYDEAKERASKGSPGAIVDMLKLKFKKPREITA